MNKKILAISMGLLIAATVLAQGVAPGAIKQCTMRHEFDTSWGIDCRGQGAVCLFEYGDCPVCCVFDTIYTVTDWIFYGLILISGFFVIMGAYKIMTAGGNPENVNTGRGYIMWAMIGLAVALLARSIPAIVRSMLNLG